jgi:hypothetical protein
VITKDFVLGKSEPVLKEKRPRRRKHRVSS